MGLAALVYLLLTHTLITDVLQEICTRGMHHEAAVYMQVKEDNIQIQLMQCIFERWSGCAVCDYDTAVGFSLEGLFRWCMVLGVRWRFWLSHTSLQRRRWNTKQSCAGVLLISPKLAKWMSYFSNLSESWAQDRHRHEIKSGIEMA